MEFVEVETRKHRNWEKLSASDSQDPSYTNLTLPYWVICRQRYNRFCRKQHKQFIKEIEKHELCQLKAWDGARIHREFLNPTLKPVKYGHIRRIVDEEVKSLVLEVAGTNVATTYITCPVQLRASLGIKLPFLVMIIKNLKKYFSFEIQILDDKGMHRRFRISNFQSTTKVLPFCTTMPIKLNIGWNQVQLNLADFTKRAYGSTYLETRRIQIHANVRIRRIYFSDMLYEDHELPKEFRLCRPVDTRHKRHSQEKRTSDEKIDAEKSSKDITEIPSGALPSPVLDHGDSPQAAQDELGQIVRYLDGEQGEQVELERAPPQVQIDNEEHIINIEENLDEETSVGQAPTEQDEDDEEEGIHEFAAAVTETVEVSGEVEEVAPQEPAAEENPVEEVSPQEPAAEENPVEEVAPQEPVAEENPVEDATEVAAVEEPPTED